MLHLEYESGVVHESFLRATFWYNGETLGTKTGPAGRIKLGIQHDGVDRRKFLKTGFQAAAGTVALGSGTAQAAIPKNKKISLTGTIPARPFGKTGKEMKVV